MTTNADFLAGIQAMIVTDVNRHYNEPPESISTADMPCAFPVMPGGGLGERVVSCVTQNKTRAIQYIVILGPTAQNTNASNYNELAEMMDNLEDAIDTLNEMNWYDYTLTTTGNFLIGGVAHWAIVADITGRNV